MKVDMTPERAWKHDILNCVNALRLNSCYLAFFERDDVLESLEAICLTADKLDELMAQLESGAIRPCVNVAQT